MSVERPYIEYVFVWHALRDACPKCRSLSEQEFHDQDIYQHTVFSVIWGDIWDLDADHTLAHPNCRCQLEVRVDVHVMRIPAFTDLQHLLEARSVVSLV